MSSESEIKNRIIAVVRNQAPDAKILLYGSRARGDAREDSDWDLLILIDAKRITPKMEKRITDPLYELEFELGALISPMLYTVDEWERKYKVTPIYRNIAREALTLSA